MGKGGYSKKEGIRRWGKGGGGEALPAEDEKRIKKK